jgi:dGTPase
MDIVNLFNEKRRKYRELKGDETRPVCFEERTEIERDYDRLLFSTPIRRMADKTQVFPLEKNDSVRTRLTHSHEVANLARSIGISLVFDPETKFPHDDKFKRNVPSLLATIGLAHDLGNPPFGHQGEKAISHWFKKNEDDIFNEGELTQQQKNDFIFFEGNAQTFRLLTKLQLLNDNYGLNLSYATLAALMKYPTKSDDIDDKKAAKKKFGIFYSEFAVAEDVWSKTSLTYGVRHPLTYIMEACDDIAYSVLDAEDAVKKGLASFTDLIDWITDECADDLIAKRVVEKARGDNAAYKKEKLSPAELNDISMQKFRVYAIAEMVASVRCAFLSNWDVLFSTGLDTDLLSSSSAKLLCKKLKEFDKKFAYKNKNVLELELVGYQTIDSLMDMLWFAITDREEFLDVSSDRKNPFSAYAYTKISENYRRIFEDKKNDLPIRYKECQLLTDMVSGMTDSFAVSLQQHLSQYFVKVNR